VKRRSRYHATRYAGALPDGCRARPRAVGIRQSGI